MRIIQVIVLVLLSATASAHAQPIQEQRQGPATGVVQAGHPCLGRWEGSAVDHPPTSGRPYGVTIEIHQTQGRNCGTIEYTLGCGGVLHDCVVTADRIEALEEYTHNPPGACAPAGRFAASCTELMQWQWRETVATHGQTATGALRKIGPPSARPPATPPAAAGSGCGCTVPGAVAVPVAWPVGLAAALLAMAGWARLRR